MKKKVRPKAQLTAASPDRLILVGEDDIDDEEILEEIFSSIDPSLRLEFISHGQKLIDHLEKVPDHALPCLIILDYNMPVLNGAEILRILNQNPRLSGCPKIIWSTSGAPAYKKICLELGASDYLVKPNKIADLEKMLRHMLSFCS